MCRFAGYAPLLRIVSALLQNGAVVDCLMANAEPTLRKVLHNMLKAATADMRGGSCNSMQVGHCRVV